MPSELYIVEIGLVKGERKARRHHLRVPLDAATGNYHRLADRTLNDLIKDMRHEQRRRCGELFDGQEAQRTRADRKPAITRWEQKQLDGWERSKPPPKLPGYDPFAALITNPEEDD